MQGGSTAGPENKRTFKLKSVCPLRSASAEEQLQWARSVYAALLLECRGDDRALVGKLRTLLHNLAGNGPNLAHHTPAHLAGLNAAQLGEGSRAAKRQKQIKNGGWRPVDWDVGVDVARAGPWGASGKELVFVVLRQDNADVFTRCFAGLGNVRVEVGSIEGQRRVVDAFVSPANTVGNMDGGIDAVYASMFGWSAGRPYRDPNPLQLAIDQRNGLAVGGQHLVKESELPIGEAILCTVDSTTSLIAAPTMVTPGKIKVNSRVVYRACRAAFAVWRDAAAVVSVACPSFGTGFGGVPMENAAMQMRDALIDAFAE